MSERIRNLSIFSWPIWVKLSVSFVVAILVPLVVLAFVVIGGVREISERNVESYVAESGARQRQVISSVFSQAQNNLNTFIAGSEHQTLLRSLPDAVGVVVNPVDKARMITVLQDALLNTGSNLYEKIELLDATGVLIVQALPGRTQSLRPTEDRSATPAYTAGLNADIQHLEQVISLSIEGNSPVIEIVNLVRPEAYAGIIQPPSGYLVARLNNQTAIYDNLITSSEFLNSQTFLITPSGIVIGPSGLVDSKSPSAFSNSIQRALAGESGIEHFDANGADSVRFYAAIPNTSFVFVNEGPIDAVGAEMVNYLFARGFAVLIGIVFLIVVLVLFMTQLIVPPLARLRSVVQAITAGNFDVPIIEDDIRRSDEIGLLIGSVADMRDHIQRLVRDLETRIAARVRDVTTTQEIGRYTATQRDLQLLMNQVVNLIVERFPNIYHAQIFLVDKERRYAVLRASTGEPGKRLLERGHRLAVGSVSVVGQATDQGQVMIARDTETSRVHKRNELLPDTLAELAIPMRIGDVTIGVLDVQSKQSDTFSQDQINVLQTLTDQIAVAIENARLYQESLTQLEALERGRTAATRQSWRDFMNNQHTQSIQSEAGSRPPKQGLSKLRQEALESGKPAVGSLTERNTIAFAIPIRLRNQILGAVEWELPQNEFDNNKVQLAQELTDRLAVSLENARLFRESQRAAERERLVNDIAGRLTSQKDIDEILQTAVREVGQALRSPRVSIRLHELNGIDNPPQNGNGHS
jgi:GAF domain-containing protein/HAMP domain-containing protein